MEKITIAGQLFQYLITGITVGSIYAMVAVGFNIIYNVTEIINFAQGEFVMLGGLIMVFFHVIMGLPLIMAFPATVILVTLVGILLDRLAIRPIRQPTVLTLIIATIAASILIKGAAMFIWGKDPYDLPAFSGRNPITVFATEIVNDTNNNPIIDQPSPLFEYGMGVLQFSIEGTKYDEETERQFAAKKKSFLAAEKSKAEREQEVQQRLMIIEKGLREKAEVEAEANKVKAKAIIEAQQKVETMFSLDTADHCVFSYVKNCLSIHAEILVLKLC